MRCSTGFATITLPHLDAALAVWRYVRDSTRWVFGDSLGDPTADDIWALAKDRRHGITRTEVRDLFSRSSRALGEPTPTASTLRLVNAVEVDYLLRDLHRDVGLHVRFEPSVVLLPSLPHLGNDETLGIFIRDVEQKARLLL